MGEFETARASLDRAERLSKELADSRILVDILRFRGMMARLEGDYDEAERHLDRAFQLADTARTGQELAEVLEETARLRWAAGRRGPAGVVLREARRAYEAVGAGQDVARIDATAADWTEPAPEGDPAGSSGENLVSGAGSRYLH
jgi:tetratricopeptide (TPR) repeat protein